MDARHGGAAFVFAALSMLAVSAAWGEAPGAAAWEDPEAKTTEFLSTLGVAQPSNASDAAVFARICGCIGKRISIRRDADDFTPVRWSVRGPDGRLVRAAEARTGSGVELDLSTQVVGVYLVTLTDASGRSITRPLSVR